jgi:tetratricopeptide (TPR) repeat protein
MKLSVAVRAALLALFLTAGTVYADVNTLCTQFDSQIEALDVRGAKQTIDRALQEDPSSCQALYRLSRVLVLLSDQEQDENKRITMYNQAVDAANKALQKNSSCMGAYVYRAAANGKIALTKGIFSVGAVVTQVRDDATKAIQLHNDTPQRLAAAYYILGRTHLNVQRKPKFVRLPLGLGWGNYDEALQYLSKARELRKDFIMFELEYARCLAEGDREQEALAVARRISALKPLEPGDQKRQQEAIEFIKDIE